MASVMNTHEEYRLSGGLGSSIIVGPIGGVLIGAVAAIAYSYAVVYIPIAGWVSFILTFLFAGAVGVGVGSVMRMSKCRSPGLAAIVGFVVGAVSLYVAWGVFLFALLRRDAGLEDPPGLVEVLMNPSGVWALVGLINEAGWYSIKSWTPTGTTLWVFWALEAGIVLLGAAMVSSTAISGEVFCERCDRWCENVGPAMLARMPETEEEFDAVAQLDTGALDRTQPPEVGTLAPHLCIVQHACPQCTDTSVAQVQLLQPKQDDKGKVSSDKSNLTSQLLVPRDLHERIAALAKREPAVPAVSPESAPADAGEEEDNPAAEAQESAS